MSEVTEQALNGFSGAPGPQVVRTAARFEVTLGGMSAEDRRRFFTDPRVTAEGLTVGQANAGWLRAHLDDWLRGQVQRVNCGGGE